MKKKEIKESKETKKDIVDKKEKLLAEGWIEIYALFEIIGRPKEHIEATLKKYVDEFTSSDNIEAIETDSGEPIEAGEDEHGKYWSSIMEGKFLIKDFSTLFNLLINYTPSRVEILSPTSITLKDSQMTNLLNELLQKLHYINQVSITATKEIAQSRKDIKHLAMNSTLLALFYGPRRGEDLAKIIGINEESMGKILMELERMGRIVKKGDLYALKIKNGEGKPKEDS